jgi:hypothetical protein
LKKLPAPITINAHSPAFVATVYAILFLPLVFIGWGWTSYFRSGRVVGRPAAAILATATFSYVFFGLSFVFRLALLGGDYSARLYRTSEFNLFLNLGLLFSLFWARGPLTVKIPTCVACALVALAWYYVVVVNSFV